MPRSASTYTPLTGHHYMDSPINPQTLKSGELQKRFNLRHYPQVGTRYVIDTTTSLAVTPASPQTAATSLTLTATVTASEAADGLAGSVAFMDGGTQIATVAVTAGSASTTATLAVGTHTLTAVFTGAGEYGNSTSAAVTHTAT